MNKLIKQYADGWVALLKGCVVATVWIMVVILPAYAFLFLFPDQME